LGGGFLFISNGLLTEPLVKEEVSFERNA